MSQYDFQDFDYSYLMRLLYASAGHVRTFGESGMELSETLKDYCNTRLMERSTLKELAT